MLDLAARVERHGLQLHSSVCFLISVSTFDLRHKLLQNSNSWLVHAYACKSEITTDSFKNAKP